MIQLYGVARSRASRNLWFLGEIGIDYDHVPVIQAYRLPDPAAAEAPLHTRSAAFLALSPEGAVPVLVDGDLVLTESLAINLHLARVHGGALGPQSPAEDAQMLASALFAATALEGLTLKVQLLVGQGKAGTEAGAAELADLTAALARPLAVVEAKLAAEGHPVGRRFTVADVNLAEILRYAQAHPPILEPYPAIRSWLAQVQARPAFRAMMEMRAAEPL